jgi:predicted nucleic acid-binding protein
LAWRLTVYLVDTNVWLERLLDQERSEEVGRFLDQIPPAQYCLTEFAFHSIGITLIRLAKRDLLLKFARDTISDQTVMLVRLGPEDIERVVAATERYKLDFDDAYQYVAAEKHDLTLVSFDADFDRTERGRKTPADVLDEPPVARDKPPTKPARPRRRKP